MNEYFDNRISDEDKVKLSSYISAESTLIPLPKSAPLVANALWPNKEICELLISREFGNSYLPIIKRIMVVPKAAFQSNSEDRPSVEKHFNSIELDKAPMFNGNIKELVLIDDVVTQGRTAYACYLKLKEMFPDVPMKLFALIRTDSFKKITTWNAPANSEIIYYESGKTFHNMDTQPIGGLWGLGTSDKK
ncbi:MAG: hypothetical protein WDM90_01075 [Ferruginibacter sp.]